MRFHTLYSSIQKLFIVVILSCFCSSFVISQQTEKDTFMLFYLGGQSNMVGFGYNSDLPETLKTDLENVYIFNGREAADEEVGGGTGKWEILKPGHGVGFTSDGKRNQHSDRFGIELSFANRLQKIYPGKKIALIKYAKNGSSLDSLAADRYGSWEMDYRGTNGINQYDHFLSTVRQSLESDDIDSNGKEDILVPTGIIWMQGESDAHNEATALRYYTNLKRLMDLIRATFHHDDLPIVIGKISDSWDDAEGKVWDYGELVQYAQEKYARTDKNAAIVRSTRYYKYSDPWHYDSKGYIDLGHKFAEAFHQLH